LTEQKEKKKICLGWGVGQISEARQPADLSLCKLTAVLYNTPHDSLGTGRDNTGRQAKFSMAVHNLVQRMHLLSRVAYY